MPPAHVGTISSLVRHSAFQVTELLFIFWGLLSHYLGRLVSYQGKYLPRLTRGAVLVYNGSRRENKMKRLTREEQMERVFKAHNDWFGWAFLAIVIGLILSVLR